MSQYNNIKITPNIGVSSDPKIEFIGAGNSTITLRVLDDVDGVISFYGQKAQLLSLVDADVSFGSSIASFSVNDFYGLPQIQAYNDGRVLVALYGSQFVGIGKTNPTEKLDVVGNVKVSGVTTTQNLYVTGVSTLGTVQISSGIVTASSGIVTYYGDGQYLENTIDITENNLDSNQYIPYAVSTGATAGLGVTTSLVYNPSSSSLGIGTTNPTTKMDVRGDVRVGIDTSQGLILTSPNGTTFRLVVDDSGTLSAISTTV